MRPHANSPAGADDWKSVRALRLEALLESPDAFTSRFEDERALPPEPWRWWTAGEGGERAGVAVTFPVEERRLQGWRRRGRDDAVALTLGSRAAILLALQQGEC
jgi:hypothetical protein